MEHSNALPLLAGLALVIATASVSPADGERLWAERFGADASQDDPGVLARAVAHGAFTSPDALSFGAGALVTLWFWAFYSHERRAWRRAIDAVPARFPSPDGQMSWTEADAWRGPGNS